MPGINPDGTQLLLGRGKVYFDRLDANGKKSGERFLGNCSSFELSIAPETKDKYSSADKSSGLLSRAVIRVNGEANIEFNEYSVDNMALGLLGDVASLVQGTTPVTGEVIGYSASPGIQLDRWYQTAAYAMSSVTVKKATVAKTIDVDYKLDLVNGRVLILSGGAGAAGDTTWTIDYTPTSKTYSLVRGGTTPLITGKLVYIGDNVVGPNHHVEIWSCQIAPDGALALISDDYGSPKLKGAILNDSANHAAEPYYRDRLIA